MQLSSSSSSFVDRIIGAIRLDPATYEEVQRDKQATWQALAVVAIASVLTGIGSSQGRGDGLVGGIVSAVLLWAIFALFAYVVGTRLLPSPATSASFEEVLRALGFSYAPAFFGILGLVPGVGSLLLFIASVWSLVAGITALRQSLEVSTGRAIAIGVVAAIIMLLITIVIALVLGFSLFAISGVVPQPAPAS